MGIAEFLFWLFAIAVAGYVVLSLAGVLGIA
jgi:hypothetical protein